jgi:hypothetical protein
MNLADPKFTFGRFGGRRRTVANFHDWRPMVVPIFGVRWRMNFQMVIAMLISCLVLPSLASAQEIAPVRINQDAALLRSGVAAVQRLSLNESRIAASLLQQTKLNNDKKTTIIVISVIAAATLIYLMYQLHHSGPFISGHF